jgi:hypothetical protein
VTAQRGRVTFFISAARLQPLKDRQNAMLSKQSTRAMIFVPLVFAHWMMPCRRFHTENEIRQLSPRQYSRCGFELRHS